MTGPMSPKLRLEYNRAVAHVEWIYFTKPLLTIVAIIGVLSLFVLAALSLVPASPPRHLPNCYSPIDDLRVTICKGLP